MLEVFSTEYIPEESQDVEAKLLLSLSIEVANYSSNVQGTSCLLCPFRIFSRTEYLKRHLKYHCAKNMYVASRRSPQLAVIRACYDFYQAIFPIGSKEPQVLNFLQHSASIIRKWNCMCSKSNMSHLQNETDLNLHVC